MIEGAAGCSRYSRSVEAVARTGRASLPAKVGISQQDNKLLWCSLFFFRIQRAPDTNILVELQPASESGDPSAGQ